MILDELRISKRHSWENNPMEYRGVIKYEGERGTIEINLNHATSMRLLAVVADSMVESSKELANNLTRDVIDSVPTLPALK